MIKIMKRRYYYPDMKRGVAKYISKFPECQKVKVECRHLAGLLLSIPIPEWKWEVISMEFMIELPRTST